MCAAYISYLEPHRLDVPIAQCTVANQSILQCLRRVLCNAAVGAIGTTCISFGKIAAVHKI